MRAQRGFMPAVWLMACLVGCGTDARAATRYVDGAAGGPTFDGSSWANAYRSVTQALTTATSGDDIWVVQGTYDEGATIPLKSGVSVYGGFSGGETALDQRDWSLNSTLLTGAGLRGVLLGANTSLLDGFVVTNGNRSGGGSGIFCDGTAPTIRNTLFASNIGNNGYGGTLRCVGETADATFSNCVFRHNTAPPGGWNGTVLAAVTGADPSFDACIFFENNPAGINIHGTLYLDNSTVTVTVNNSTFASNRTGVSYGAVAHTAGADNLLTMSNCVFLANNAGWGGALYLGNGTVAIRNSSFIGNIASGGGGVAYVVNANGVIEDCTFVGNTAAANGGGVYWSSGLSSCLITHRRCVFVNNSATGPGGALANADGYTFEDCVFSGNRGSSYGGLCAANSSATVFRRCVFTGNESGDPTYGGGVLYTQSTAGSPHFDNCLLAGNVSAASGGAIYAWNGSSLGVNHSTFAGNRGNGSFGGAIHHNGGSGIIAVTNTVAWTNRASSSGHQFYEGAAGRITVYYSTVQGGWSGTGGSNSSSDPNFTGGPAGTWSAVGPFTAQSGQTALTSTGAGWGVNAYASHTVNPDLGQYLQFTIASNSTDTLYVWGNALTNRAGTAVAGAGDSFQIHYYLPQAGSPVIDAGTNIGFTNDLVHTLRPQGSGYDMGAYEAGFITTTSSTTTSTTTDTSSSSTTTTTSTTSTTTTSTTTTSSTTTTATRWFVDRALGVSGSHDGTSWANAFTNIGNALAAAVTGQDLWVAAGTYDEGSTLTLKAGVGVYGGFTSGMATRDARDWTANPTLIDGLGVRRPLTGTTGAILDGFIVTNGYSAVSGGALLNSGAAPTILNTIFDSNVSAQYGGAVESSGEGADAVFSNCVFRFNRVGNSYEGSAVRATGGADPVFYGCTFLKNNPAGVNVFGALKLEGGSSVVVNDSLFASNSAGAIYGGAVSITTGGELVASNTVFQENIAAWGGAMYVGNGVLTLRDVKFAQNTVSGGGGAIYAVTVSGTVDDTDFIGNAAGVNGGGALWSQSRTACTLSFLRSRFVANMATGAGGGLAGSDTHTYDQCTFSGNRSTTAYGGLYSSSDAATVFRRSRFAGNESAEPTYGSAVAYYQGTATVPTFENCLFAGNVTAGSGGALYAYSGSRFDVVHSTFVGNRAGAYGGAVYHIGGSVLMTITNSIFWGNSAATAGNQLYENAANRITVNYSAVEGGWAGLGGNNTSADPLFSGGPAGNWTTVGPYDATAGQTALAATGAGWTVNALQELTINPDTTQYLQFVIASNSTDTLYVWGNALTNRAGTAVAGIGDTYQIHDYFQTLGSPVIDTGVDAGLDTDILGTSRPQAGGFDMGAFEGGATTTSTTSSSTTSSSSSTTTTTSTSTDSSSTSTSSTSTTSSSSTTSERLYVDAALGMSGSHDGTSWANAFTNIGNALSAAVAGQEIWVAAGTYDETSTLTLKADVAVYGGFTSGMANPNDRDWVAHPTLIDGLGARRPLTGTTGAVLDGFIVTNGYSATSGGALLNSGAAPLIRNTIFDSNVSAQYGGAVESSGENADAVFSNCVFRFNRAGNSYEGSAVRATGGADPEFHACTFLRNNPDGVNVFGALKLEGASTVVVNESLFASNHAGVLYGGAIAITAGGALVASNTVFRENTASWAGALYVGNGVLTLREVAFVRNTASGGGGAVYAVTVSGTVEDADFIGNTAGANGGGAIWSQTRTTCTLSFLRSRFVANTATGAGGALAGSDTHIYDQCTFSGNRCTVAYGGLYSSSDAATVFRRSRFAGNESAEPTYGSAVAYYQGTATVPTIENCLFAGNVTAGSGGALYAYSGSRFDVVHSTFVGNRAGAYGGALYHFGGAVLMTVTNNIFWGNSAATGGDQLYESAANRISLNYSTIEGGWGGLGSHNTAGDPKFTSGPAGIWSDVGPFDADQGQTPLTASDAGWAANAHQDLTVNPDMGQHLQFVIASNTVDTLYVWGNALTNRAGSVVAEFGDTFQIHNYLPKFGSAAINTGVEVGVTVDIAGEARPQAGGVDMGAYERPPRPATTLVTFE